jgi:GNAT superfamily N-acetyltransferase
VKSNVVEPTVARFSEIDTNRFGMRIARAQFADELQIQSAIAYCQTQNIAMLIARVDTQYIHIAQFAEAHGFLLMDSLVYYSIDLQKAKPSPQPTVAPFQQGELPDISEIARQAFRNYLGHYHADPRLDKAQCDATYISWAERSCQHPEVADVVLVAHEEGQPVGFLTLRRNSDEEVEIPLNAVLPTMQGRGVYQSLLQEALLWSAGKGFRRLVVSTQINNIPVQKAWARQGLEMHHSYYTFHKWFDGQ